MGRVLTQQGIVFSRLGSQVDCGRVEKFFGGGGALRVKRDTTPPFSLVAGQIRQQPARGYSQFQGAFVFYFKNEAKLKLS